MIFMDYNQIFLTTLFASLGNHLNTELDENILRHMFLNVCRSVRKKFGKDYGELVICCDGKNTWRRKAFPYYKAGRKEGRDESEIDWNHLFSIMTKVRTEISENFPYKVIHLEGAEADDIIGVLGHRYGEHLVSEDTERHLIYSSDKDYIQLHVYGNIEQYNPVLKKWITTSDPENYLWEHIIRGDKGDGIPNILSEDNSLVLNIRQKAITKKRLLNWKENPDSMDTITKARFARNKMLIDFGQIPQEYVDKINKEFDEAPVQSRRNLLKYFIEHKLKNLVAFIDDF